VWPILIGGGGEDLQTDVPREPESVAEKGEGGIGRGMIIANGALLPEWPKDIIADIRARLLDCDVPRNRQREGVTPSS
jgi:hypothetical protein